MSVCARVCESCALLLWKCHSITLLVLIVFHSAFLGLGFHIKGLLSISWDIHMEGLGYFWTTIFSSPNPEAMPGFQLFPLWDLQITSLFLSRQDDPKRLHVWTQVKLHYVSWAHGHLSIPVWFLEFNSPVLRSYSRSITPVVNERLMALVSSPLLLSFLKLEGSPSPLTPFKVHSWIKLFSILSKIVKCF